MMQLEHSKIQSLANSYQKSKNAPKEAKSTGRWTKEEHQRFIEGIRKFGKNWKLVEDFVATRSGAQIRSHAQKFFNRLERDFNLKFDDLNSQATKDRFNETLMKMPDFHDDHNEAHVKSEKPRKNSEKTVCGSPESATEMNSKLMSMSSSPKIDHMENESAKKDLIATRKVSEEMKNHSFFDIILTKIISSNNNITTPKLSDFLNLSSSSIRASFDASHLESEQNDQTENVQNLFKSSFKLHSKNMTEGNMKNLNQLRRSENNLFNDAELIGKKLKTN